MTVGMSLAVTVILLVLNAFFVAVEFAIVTAKRHRLEERAAEGSRAAKASVNAIRELSLMLAGCQLGITLATLGLGALSEPAIASLITPVFEAMGLSYDFGHLIAIVIAVAIVVFLHMVIGEMAPKSWAISHPETSAMLLAIPFRAFAWLVRPVLHLFNETANQMLRMIRVDPVENVATTQGPADLLLLLAQSHEHGVLPDADHQLLTGALKLENETVTTVMLPMTEAVCIDRAGTAGQVEAICRDSGRSRLFVTEEDRIVGLVHVRDAVMATAQGGHDLPLSQFLQDTVSLPSGLPLIDAVSTMRQERGQLALVTGEDGAVIGLTSLEDILEQILGEFDDETDETLVL
ncbi:MAG: hemolysin family protein [Actinomycetota bacterium]|nr:hemolysin family protein [Actinomycetota bacterium]